MFKLKWSCYVYDLELQCIVHPAWRSSIGGDAFAKLPEAKVRHIESHDPAKRHNSKRLNEQSPPPSFHPPSRVEPKQRSARLEFCFRIFVCVVCLVFGCEACPSIPKLPLDNRLDSGQSEPLSFLCPASARVEAAEQSEHVLGSNVESNPCASV